MDVHHSAHIIVTIHYMACILLFLFRALFFSVVVIVFAFSFLLLPFRILVGSVVMAVLMVLFFLYVTAFFDSRTRTLPVFLLDGVIRPHRTRHIALTRVHGHVVYKGREEPRWAVDVCSLVSITRRSATRALALASFPVSYSV